MKKVFLLILSITYTLLLTSCGTSGDKIKPIRTETVDFDMQIAKQMIEQGDKIISDITAKDKVSRQEYNQFLSSIVEAYDKYDDVEWKFMFFYNDEIENKKLDFLSLQNNVFYPTIYNKDIEVVSAKITNTYYKNEFFNTCYLTIRAEYLGEDSKLNNWYREYIYEKNDEGNWVFYAFDGEMNFTGEDFTPDYLEIK